jgi:hypothetical protein
MLIAMQIHHTTKCCRVDLEERLETVRSSLEFMLYDLPEAPTYLRYPPFSIPTNKSRHWISYEQWADIENSGLTLGGFGAVTGFFVVFFFSDIPRLRKDVMTVC